MPPYSIARIVGLFALLFGLTLTVPVLIALWYQEPELGGFVASIRDRNHLFPASGLWKCEFWTGTTASRTCCSTSAGEPIAETFVMISGG